MYPHAHFYRLKGVCVCVCVLFPIHAVVLFSFEAAITSESPSEIGILHLKFITVVFQDSPLDG